MRQIVIEMFNQRGRKSSVRGFEAIVSCSDSDIDPSCRPLASSHCIVLRRVNSRLNSIEGVKITTQPTDGLAAKNWLLWPETQESEEKREQRLQSDGRDEQSPSAFT
jgi:hypothetical protein